MGIVRVRVMFILILIREIVSEIIRNLYLNLAHYLRNTSAFRFSLETPCMTGRMIGSLEFSV